MRKNFWLLAIIVVAFLARFIGLASYPTGFTQDEAALGYDAYSIYQTGRDQWGNFLPLVLRSLGDFKMPLYSYLAIPSVFLFGLNEFAVRLPNAILGTFAVLLTFLMVYQLTGNKRFGLLSSLFLALSPWHISLSRGAFEANLTTFFVPLGVWAFIKGVKNQKWMLISVSAFGLNLFSYHSARFFTPLIILVLILFFLKDFRKISFGENIKRYKLTLLIFGFFVSALILSLSQGAGKRALDITIFNPTDRWKAVSDRRYEAIIQGLPDQVARLFSNKLIYDSNLFVNNYLSYVSPEFLFTRGAGEWSYGMVPGRGVLYAFEAILLIAALTSFIKGRGFNKMGLFLTWILLSIVPAAITKGPGYAANRAAVMMPAVQVISSYGAIYLIEVVKNFSRNNKLSVITSMSLVSILAISFIGFLEDYFYHTTVRGAESMQFGRRKIVDSIKKVEDDYNLIFVSRTLSAPNIWIQFYEPLDPKEVQDASKNWLLYEKLGFPYLDQLDDYKVGKYQFGSIKPEILRYQDRVLVVGKPDEFATHVIPLVTINYPDGRPAYVLVDIKSL